MQITEERQLAASREVADRRDKSLSALADKENVSEEFKRQLDVARERMKKYKGVYRALAR
jgi:hypothetical protein